MGPWKVAPEFGRTPRLDQLWQLTKSEEKVKGAVAVINSFFSLIKRLKCSVSAASCGCDSDALDDAEIH